MFIAHGVVTLAAAVVLMIAPAAFSTTIGVSLSASQYVLSYFLAVAELASAVLSIGASRLTDRSALVVIAWVFVLFHASTAALEMLYMTSTGVSPVLVLNVIVRAVACGLFRTAGVSLAGRRTR